MVPLFQDHREGGGLPQNVRKFLPGISSSHPYFWLGDMGGEPTYGPPPREFPPQGVDKADRDTTAEMDEWDMIIYPSGS